MGDALPHLVRCSSSREPVFFSACIDKRLYDEEYTGQLASFGTRWSETALERLACLPWVTDRTRSSAAHPRRGPLQFNHITKSLFLSVTHMCTDSQFRLHAITWQKRLNDSTKLIIRCGV